MADCEHVKALGPEPTPRTPEGCEECLASGQKWVALRECLTCGHIGCCDSSPGMHATAHFDAEAHPVMQAFQVADPWRWCYVDKAMV